MDGVEWGGSREVRKGDEGMVRAAALFTQWNVAQAFLPVSWAQCEGAEHRQERRCVTGHEPSI
jgi:hypothetical protein